MKMNVLVVAEKTASERPWRAAWRLSIRPHASGCGSARSRGRVDQDRCVASL
jgi:hypothetical protein